jgi:hypothetical protein
MFAQSHCLVGNVPMFLLRGFEFCDGAFEGVATMRLRLFDLLIDLTASPFERLQFLVQA